MVKFGFLIVMAYIVVTVLIVIKTIKDYRDCKFVFGSFKKFLLETFDIYEILRIYLFLVPFCVSCLLILMYCIKYGDVDVFEVFPIYPY